MHEDSLRVLVVGSGGREHALCWKISTSDQLEKLWCAPGNAGIAEVAECVNPENIVQFARENNVHLVIIGPEQPLVDGVSDRLREAGILVFGCSQAASALEASKGFTKDLCKKYNIPTAAYGRFSDAVSAKTYLARQRLPIVVKADGLAAGKGVTITHTLQEAIDAVETVFSGALGAQSSVVIEEFLTGEEASFFALTDGKTIRAFAGAQDHKTAFDGDTGPNTGGMGTYSPAPVLTPEVEEAVMEHIIRPTVEAMKAEGLPFTGILFAGLMITDKGPQLIEYNVRFGDPETQSLMLRLESDILPVLLACAKGEGLENVAIRFKPEAALCVVMAAKGYPAAYEKGTEITSLPRNYNTAHVFHAGTERKEGKLLATGGRVLGITALGKTVSEAQANAYTLVKQVVWENGFCRKDIGWRAVEREKTNT